MFVYLSLLARDKDDGNRIHAMRKHGYIYKNVVACQLGI